MENCSIHHLNIRKAWHIFKPLKLRQKRSSKDPMGTLEEQQIFTAQFGKLVLTTNLAFVEDR